MIKADVPRDLETIILKATANESQHRYATASDMADDLRCFLEDRPIAARRASNIERLGRWMRRNPALAASLVATLLLLAATTVVTSWGYVTTSTALMEAKLARDEAFNASKQADVARKQAEANQSRAENNLNVALQAFDAIFDNVAQRGVPQSLSQDMQQAAKAEDDLAADASAKATRENAQFEITLNSADAELLNSLLKFYSKFAAQNDADASLQTRIAQAYQRIGQIQLRLGKSDEALASYRSAIDLLEKLHDERADDAAIVLALAKVYNDLGLALSTLSRDVGEIVSNHKAAIGFLSAQPKAITSQPNVRFELARGYDLAGSILGRSGATSLEDMVNPRGGIRPPGWLRFGFNGPPPEPRDPNQFPPAGPIVLTSAEEMIKGMIDAMIDAMIVVRKIAGLMNGNQTIATNALWIACSKCFGRGRHLMVPPDGPPMAHRQTAHHLTSHRRTVHPALMDRAATARLVCADKALADRSLVGRILVDRVWAGRA